MIAIVSGVHPDVVPNRFDGIVFRAVRWQRAKMKAMSVTREPLLHLGSGVVRGVVVNEEDLLFAVALCHGREKHRVRIALEHWSMCVVEPGPVEIHRPKYLLCVTLAGRRHQRLMPAPRPGLVEARVLPEAGFVPEKQSGLALSRFFLAWDRCIVAIGLAPPDRL